MSKHFDPELFDSRDADDEDPEDRITCQRCGAQGLHWKDVITSDGKSEKPRLFNERNRPHVCSGVNADDFGVVK